MNPIHLKFVYSEEEHHRMRTAVRKSTFLGRWLPFLIAPVVLIFSTLIFILVTGSRAKEQSDQQLSLPTMFLIACAVVAYNLWSLPRKNKRNDKKYFQKLPLANTTVEYSIDENGLDITSVVSNATVQWDAYIKATESNYGFLLFTQPNLAEWISKSAFGSNEDLKSFRSLIQEHKIKLTRF